MRPRVPESGGEPEAAQITPSTPDKIAMDAETTPATTLSMIPNSSELLSSDTQATPSASYAVEAHATQELFSDPPPTEPSCKRAPSSPAKGDKPAAKKSTITAAQPATPNDIPFFLSLMKAISKWGQTRTRLMSRISGDLFYHWQALHVQSKYGGI